MGAENGRKGRLYLNAGTHAAPSWVLLARTQNVTVAAGKNSGSLDDRSSDWQKDLGGSKTLAFTLGVTKIKGADTVYDTLLDSYVNDTPIEVAAMNTTIATSGAKGWRAFCIVTKLDDKQELNSPGMHDVELKLTEAEEGGDVVEPDWYEVP